MLSEKDKVLGEVEIKSSMKFSVFYRHIAVGVMPFGTWLVYILCL